jgi:hypothetical protein
MVFGSEDESDLCGLCGGNDFWRQLAWGKAMASVEASTAGCSDDEAAVGHGFPEGNEAARPFEDISGVNGHRPGP